MYFLLEWAKSWETEASVKDCRKFKGFKIVLGATIKDTFDVNLGLEFLNGCF